MAASSPPDAGEHHTMERPLFVKLRDLPRREEYYTTREMCIACESVAGFESMEGAQLLGGVWRLYPATEETRNTLLLSGITINDFHVDLHDINPFNIYANGTEIRTTRVCLSDIPLSFNNEDLEQMLKKLGCTLRSDMKYECDRDEHKRLTRWKNGRWFVYIEVPAKPLPKQWKIGKWTCKIYHREQPREQRQQLKCFQCGEQGHFSR